MKENDLDLFPCRVMIVVRNLIKNRYQVNGVSNDLMEVTVADIAKATGESIERISVAIRKLEDLGMLDEKICRDGKVRIRMNREDLNDSTWKELEVSPEANAMVEWFAERECLTLEEATDVILSEVDPISWTARGSN